MALDNLMGVSAETLSKLQTAGYSISQIGEAVEFLRQRDIHHQYYLRTKQQRRQQYHDEHEERLAYGRWYYYEHRDQVKAYNKQWAELHKDISNAIHMVAVAKRRSRDAGFFTVSEWIVKCSVYGNCCVYCGLPAVVIPEGKLTHDHMIPLSRGGLNYIENIVPACFACNREKCAMTSEEFFKSINDGKQLGVLARRYKSTRGETKWR